MGHSTHTIHRIDLMTYIPHTMKIYRKPTSILPTLSVQEASKEAVRPRDLEGNRPLSTRDDSPKGKREWRRWFESRSKAKGGPQLAHSVAQREAPHPQSREIPSGLTLALSSRWRRETY